MKFPRICVIILLFSFMTIIMAQVKNARSIPSLIKRLDPHLRQDEMAVFMIYQVDTCCRPIIHLDEILAKKKLILLIFHPDFSDEDIENFKYAFKTPSEARFLRMNERWLKLFLKLQENNKNKNKGFFNYYLDISRGKIKAIEAF